MNKQCYRHIFNKARGMVMVVADIAKSQSQSSNNTRPRTTSRFDVTTARLAPMTFALQLLLGGIMLPSITWADIVADGNASGSQQPAIITAGNGVPLVNIQTPSAAGVSRNAYQQFDVDSQGAILNNSRTDVQTQLGGWVNGNASLAGGTANIILNEVNSSNPSLLNGYIEVAGDRAQVVIANPAGISCSGCGFLNASRSTLTTGEAIINNGNLEGYRVEGGEITIEGSGLDTNTADFTDIISRSVSINASIWANDLKMTTGTNEVSADHATITEIDGDDNRPTVGIDVSELGGMYAGKITLVGTEDGVGVINSGDIGANVGEVVITADGRLENRGNLWSETANITIDIDDSVDNEGTIKSAQSATIETGDDFTNNGQIDAVGVAITAQDAIQNNGHILSEADIAITTGQFLSDDNAVLAAGIQGDGSIGNSGDITLDADGHIELGGQHLSGDTQTIHGDSIRLAGSEGSASDMTLTADIGEIDISDSQLTVDNTWTANTTERLITDDATVSADTLDITAQSLSNERGDLQQTGSSDLRIAVTGDINNSQGSIRSNSESLHIQSTILNNREGTITHAGGGELSIEADSLRGAEGDMATNGDLAINAAEMVLDNATTTSQGPITIDSETFSHQQGTLIQVDEGDASIRATEVFNNDGGMIASAGTLNITADDLTNNGGTIQVTGTDKDLIINATSTVSNRESNDTVGDLFSVGNTTISAEWIDNTGSHISAGGDLSLESANTLDNAEGTITANQALTVDAGDIDNSDGTLAAVNADAHLITTDGTLNNTQGRIEAATALTIDSQGINNTRGTLVADQQSLNTNDQAFDNQSGQIIVNGTDTLTINSGELNNEAGLIQANANISIDTNDQTLTNTASGSDNGIIGQGDVTLATGELNNQEGYIGSVGNLTATATAFDNTQGGILLSQADVNLNTNTIANSSGQIQAADALDIDLGNGELDNEAGLIRAGGVASLTAGDINNNNTQGEHQGIESEFLDVQANTFSNIEGLIRTDDHLDLRIDQQLNNTQGDIVSAAGSLTISDSDLAITNTDGTLFSASTLAITSASLTGDGNLYSQGNINITLTEDYTHTGEFAAMGQAVLQTNGTLTNHASLNASQSLNLQAAEIVTHSESDIQADTLTLTAETIEHRGLINGITTMIDAGGSLDNIGTGRIYGDHVSIAATTVNNLAEDEQAPIIAARERLDIGAQTINNHHDALLFSAGSLHIGGELDDERHATGQAALLNNRSAAIESLGDMSLSAQTLNNINETFETDDEIVTTETITEYKMNRGDVYRASDTTTRYTPDEVRTENCEATCLRVIATGARSDAFTRYNFTRTITDEVVITSDPAAIIAGGNLTIDADTATNDKSRILAGGDINITGNTVNNIEHTSTRQTTDEGTATRHWRDREKGNDHTDTDTTSYRPAPVAQTITLGAAQYEANTAVTGTGTDVAVYSNNTDAGTTASASAVDTQVRATSTIEPITRFTLNDALDADSTEAILTGGVNFDIPNNSLFTSQPDAPNGYIIETDPNFADYRTWLSSDYLLDALALDPAMAQQRLGDGFYEQRLVREQIASLTGRRYLAGYETDDEAQYQQLMQNAVAFAQEYQLMPGLALSAEQMAALTTDIVWLVEKAVTLQDGETVQALVPQVYVRVNDTDIDTTGALIAADNSLNLNLSGDLNNYGSIAGRRIADISADNINNLGGRLSGDRVTATAAQDINNIGGRITARDALTLSAGRDLRVESTTRTITSSQGSRTTLDRVAGLYVTRADGRLSASAERDVVIKAAAVDSAGEAEITSGRDLLFQTAETNSDNQVTWDSDNYERESQTAEIGSTVNSHGDLTLQAGGDINARAATVTSDKNLTATADGDITLTAGNSTESIDQASKYSSTSGFSKRTVTTREQSEQTTVQGSQLQGENVQLNAGNDLTLTSSTIAATDDISLNATGDTLITATQASDYRKDKFDEKKNFGRKATETNESLSIDTIASELNAGGNITLNATINPDGTITQHDSGAVTVKGSTLNANDNIVVNGDEITVLAMRDLNFQRHEKTKRGTLGLSKSNEGSMSREQLLHQAQIETLQEDLSLLSGGNITILGSDVISGGDINLEAVDDILINADMTLTETKHWAHTSRFSPISVGTIYELEESAKGSSQATMNASSLQAQGDINLDASRATIVGSDLTAGQDINATTDVGDIQIISAQEALQSYEEHKSASATLGDVLEQLTEDAIDMLDVKKQIDAIGTDDEKSQAKLSLTKLEYRQYEGSTQAIDNRASSLSAGGNITLDAAGDIDIQGSDLGAQEDINLQAEGDVSIREAGNSRDSQSKEITATGELSVVVQHQAVEIVKAAQAVDEAKDKVKDAKEDYRQYEKDLQQLKNTRVKLTRDYANKVPGISYEDIVELDSIIGDMEADEEWYQAGMVLAAANLASKITLLAQQTAAGAASVATWGFNAGIQLDLEATKTETENQQESSRASTLAANNIRITTGNDTTRDNTSTLIRGSHLAANNLIQVTTGDLTIEASRDNGSNKTDTEQAKIRIAQTLYGAAGGPTVSVDYNRSRARDGSTTFNNSTLNANNIQLSSTGDTTIKGANVRADDTLTMDVSGDLLVQSQQDRYKAKNKSIGISAGAGTSGGQVSSVNGGVNMSNGDNRVRETVLTSLTGNNVDINVENHTAIIGATIAATDEEGNDTENLTLNTQSLDFVDLSNTNYNRQKSAGLSTSIGINNSADPNDPNQQNSTDANGEKDAKLNTSNIAYSNSSTYDKTKTLATIGKGNLTVRDDVQGCTNVADAGCVGVTDENGTDSTERLNRDIEKTEKELFSVKRQEGNIDLTIDHRLLNEEGRKQIREDIKRNELIGSALVDVVTEESVRLQDTLQHIGDVQRDFDVQKLMATQNGGVNAEILNNLAAATIEEKQQAINAYAAAYAETYNITIDQATVIAVNTFVGGAYTNANGDQRIYINDAAQDNALDYANTIGHEVTHAQINQNASMDRGSAELNDEYAQLRGEYAEDNYDFNFSNSGLGQVNTGSTNANIGNNSDTVQNNNRNYYQEDQTQLEYSCMHSATGRCVDLAHDQQVLAHMIAGNPDRAAELIEVDLLASNMQLGREDKVVEMLTTASPEVIEQALALQLDRQQEDEANLLAGGVLVALLAAPAAPTVMTAMVQSGRIAATELAAFISNPLTYCKINPALCLTVVEEVGYTAAGATAATSLIPDVPVSGIKNTIDDVVESITRRGESTFRISLEEINSLKSLYSKAPEAKVELDSIADDIAKNLGGTVAKAPVKSQERAIEKVINDYDGDASKIKDLARNTIIVDSNKIDNVVSQLNNLGANVKKIDESSDPLGYSGVNSSLKTKVGVNGEIQVNTPEMIYAKEPEGIARQLLGNDRYDSIASKTKVEGGLGHKYYEEWRVIKNKDSNEAKAIANKSRAYYESVRGKYAN